jgi:hypothetical protein
MASDEELERAFGEPRPQPRLKQITEDEWRGLVHSVDRIDRRVGRISNWSITIISAGASYIAVKVMELDGWGNWATGIVAVVVFLGFGTLGQRDFDQDDVPAWLRGRPKKSRRRALVRRIAAGFKIKR